MKSITRSIQNALLEDVSLEKEDKVDVTEEKQINEAVKPRPSYIDYLKQLLGDTYKEESDDNTFIVRGETEKGSVVALWTGKAEKPQIYAIYKDDEQREQAINDFLDRRQARAKQVAERKQARRLTRDHNVKVGDIYYCSWGYDQTNIDFYKVVDVRGSRIDLKELTTDFVSFGQGGYEDEVTAGDSFASDKIYTVSARADGTLTGLSSFEYLTKWDGKPLGQTNAYSGH